MSSDGGAAEEPTRRAPRLTPSQLGRLYKLELDHSLAGFSAIIPPVFFTMLLSAITVLYITPESQGDFQDSSLLLFNENSATSGKQAASFGLANAFIIIGAITVMTFIIVLLLYFKCELIFAIYLVFALVMLMGFTTGLMVVEGLKYYSVPTDIVTLGIFFYNYAIVGAIVIFSYEVGLQGSERLIPYNLAQVYLVIISVVMAWLVTNIFPFYTTWALLVALALYDLFAVLTPCGPLNLLIKVVTKRAEEEENNRQNQIANGENNSNGDPNRQKQLIPGLLYEVNTGAPKRRKKYNLLEEQGNTAEGSQSRLQQESNVKVRTYNNSNNTRKSKNSDGAAAAGVLAFVMISDKDNDNLSLLDVQDGNENERESLRAHSSELIENVESTNEANLSNRSNKSATERPIEEVLREDYDIDYDEFDEPPNLKLGLGDFVFYSVLTAKAAEYGFLAFITVACCVLCGLCGTLVLLSVFQKALPALPISIALGVATYIMAFKFISPFADDLALNLVSV